MPIQFKHYLTKHITGVQSDSLICEINTNKFSIENIGHIYLVPIYLI